MRLMPFRASANNAVVCRPPRLRIWGKAYEPGSEIPEWDYLTEVTIEGELSIKNDLLLSSTGLARNPGLAAIRAVLRVDCPATGKRFLGISPLNNSDQPVSLKVRVPAGEAAEELEVRYEIVLDAPDGPAPENRAAHQRGSRLYGLNRPYRFRLEGDGSSFPIEAFEFAGGDFPTGSVWVLKFQDEDLAVPYLSAVRLYVNTAHSEGAKLVHGKSDTALSVLKRDVLLQLLLKLAVHDRDDLGVEYQEGSASAVIGSLCDIFLGQTLRGAVELMRDDPGRVCALLQRTTGFLKAKS